MNYAKGMGIYLDSASGSWKDYKMIPKKFCSKQCCKNYKQNNRQEIKAILSSENSREFRRLLFRRNPTVWLDSILSFAGAGGLSYFAVKDFSSSSFFFLFFAALLMVYGIWRLTKPWIVSRPF